MDLFYIRLCLKGSSSYQLLHLRFECVMRPVMFFPVNSVILIDTERECIVGDYVLASIRNNKPTIKQIIEEDGMRYLAPIGAMLPAEKMKLNNKILGTIVEYRINLKKEQAHEMV